MISVSLLIFLLGTCASVPLRECPLECTCEDAPLRSAAFVLTWMTSWGEDDLPEFHPKQVLTNEDFVVSSTARDAEVDVDEVGLHATCALWPETNLTHLFTQLPSRTMVLSVLQAAGSKLIVVEAGQLAPLKELKALHLQGYAKRQTTQVSGFSSNRVLEMVEHKEQMAEVEDEEQDLQLALSEEALTPLTNLQLLDLQYARLVAGLEGGRPRRQTYPLSTTTLLDLPLTDFLSLTDRVQDLELPPELSYRTEPQLPNNIQPHPEFEFVLMDDEEPVVPYEVFKSESEVMLAPFRALSKLKYLRVAHAKLDRIGPELLTGLENLHTLTLEHNHIKVLPTAMFAPTPDLRHLSLAHNNILTLDGDSLAGLDNLLTLDLDDNKIESLGTGSFPRLPSLATLRLLNNPLKHVFPFSFTNINATEQLLLGSRHVSVEFHVDTFRQLNSLSVLQIENTTLLSLSRELLEGMQNLKQLTIHGHISYIDFDAFTATPDLESLTLSHCHLQKLSLDAFFGLRNIRHLDLSHNALDEISPGTFDHLSSLRELYLHHNNLTTLPLGIFTPTPAKLIQLHENPWHCTCDLLQLRPTITNKVRRPEMTTCWWDEKQGTVCRDDEPARLRYDSRVAPLCHTPPKHRHHGVFHVTSRKLRCPRHIWDPRPRSFWPNRNRMQEAEEEEEEEDADVDTETPVAEEEPSWLPLTAFSLPPFEVKDLLQIAEAEMPEEVFAPLTDAEVEEIQRNKENIEILDANIENRENATEDLLIVSLTTDTEIPQGDQGINLSARPVASALRNQKEIYRQQKEEEKARIAAEREREMEAQQLKKEEYKRRLAEEKKKLKALMAAEEERERIRKMEELEDFLMQQQRHQIVQEKAQEETLVSLG